MHVARTHMRRIIASLMLAVLAVFAVASSAHAGLHALGHPHGSNVVRAQVEGDLVASHASGGAEQGDVAVPDAPDCSCCHATMAALTPGPAPGLVLRGPGRCLALLAAPAPPSTRPEGLRRPPRLL